MTHDELLVLAIRAAQEAGKIIASMQQECNSFEYKPEVKEGIPNYLTQADTQAHKTITRILRESGIPVLSEEEDFSSQPERVWIVDPLDGTKEFVHNRPDWCVMIGLVEHNEPALGVIYVYPREELYFASKGKGAFKQTDHEVTKLQVRNHKPPVAIINSVPPSNADDNILSQLSSQRIVGGSSGYRICLLSSGAADFHIETRPISGIWDICAGQIILSEAGGITTDSQGTPINYANVSHTKRYQVVYATPKTHKKIISLTQS